MRKLILEWLFGTNNVDYYMQLLRENMDNCDDGIKHANECIELIDAHKKTLEREKWFIELSEKLIRICENHGIDIDEEIKHVRLYDNNEVNTNETERMER